MTKLKPYNPNEGKPDKPDVETYLWKYVPSLPAGVIVAGLFAIITLYLLYRLVSTRTRFSLPYVAGGVLEFIGFSARAVATNNTDELLPYAIQSIFILIAPALYAASVYMALSRLMRRLHAENLSIVSTKWLTKIFILGDVLSFLIQAGGGGLASTAGNNDIDPEIPKYIVLVGLFVQVIVFGLFIVTIVMFHKRLGSDGKGTPARYENRVNWKRIVVMLYVVSAMIMLRSIYRIVEYAMGMDSYFFQHEWPTYVLDGVPMLVTMFLWGIFYPEELSRYAIINDSGSDIPLNEQSGPKLHPEPYYSSGPQPYYSSGPQPYYAGGPPPPVASYA